MESPYIPILSYRFLYIPFIWGYRRVSFLLPSVEKSARRFLSGEPTIREKRWRARELGEKAGKADS
jgi:hypothetical protein